MCTSNRAATNLCYGDPVSNEADAQFDLHLGIGKNRGGDPQWQVVGASDHLTNVGRELIAVLTVPRLVLTLFGLDGLVVGELEQRQLARNLERLPFDKAIAARQQRRWDGLAAGQHALGLHARDLESLR